MLFTIPIYQRRGDRITWTTLFLGPHTVSESRRTEHQVHEALATRLREILRQRTPAELSWFAPPLDLELERPHLELSLQSAGKRRRLSGFFPLVIGRKESAPGHTMHIAFHPDRQQEWFPLRTGEPLDEQAALYFQGVWADLDDFVLESLKAPNKDRIRMISLDATPQTLLDLLPKRKKGLWDDLLASPFKNKDRDQEERGRTRLRDLGQNLTAKVIDGLLPVGIPRSPYREQLMRLLLSDRKEPTLLVGPQGVGKSTIFNHFVLDLLTAEDYPAHQNLDRVTAVYAISGRRLIAGMTYLGDWQERCLELLVEARKRKVLLHIDDLHLFGRLGQSRESNACFADVFRGPLARGEITFVGECTEAQIHQLEDEAPAFARLFARVVVAPTKPDETLRLLLREVHGFEKKHKMRVDPTTYQSVLELSSALFPERALPGKALDLMRQAVIEVSGAQVETDKETALTGDLVRQTVARYTGLNPLILDPERRLPEDEVAAHLRGHVLGQDAAIQAAVDLLLRIKAGLTDPHRPYGVYLFTGPTGVGKTELARRIAEFLYGGAERLLRLDMGEYSAPDAPNRLLGDRYFGPGTLTGPVQEQPFCVVLLDEIEKAHPRALHLLLQLFDEGRLTDATGTTASFTQAVVIMTSNLGQKSRGTIGFQESPQAVLADVARAVKEFFPPELFNRIDRVVPFSPLTKEVATGVAQKELSKLLTRRGLSDRNVFVSVPGEVIDQIALSAFDTRHGARSVKKYLEDEVGSLLSEELAASGAAVLRRAALSVSGHGKIAAKVDTLPETQQFHGGLPLLPMLNFGMKRLREELQGALATVEEIENGEELKRLGSTLAEHLRRHHEGDLESADQLYVVDSLQQDLAAFKEQVQGLLTTPVLDAAEEAELQKFTHVEVTMRDELTPRRYRLFDRRELSPRLRKVGRRDLLLALSTAHKLRRVMHKLDDLGQHSVFVEITCPAGLSGPPEVAGLLQRGKDGGQEELWQVLLRHMDLDNLPLAARKDDGSIVEFLLGSDTQERGTLRQIVARVDRLFALDALQLEVGCHLFQPLTRPPELCRVRVLPAPPQSGPRHLVEASSREELVTLLPLTRRLRFESKGDAPAPVEVEDFALGFVHTVVGKSLHDGLDPVSLLSMAREESP